MPKCLQMWQFCNSALQRWDSYRCRSAAMFETVTRPEKAGPSWYRRIHVCSLRGLLSFRSKIKFRNNVFLSGHFRVKSQISRELNQIEQTRKKMRRSLMSSSTVFIQLQFCSFSGNSFAWRGHQTKQTFLWKCLFQNNFEFIGVLEFIGCARLRFSGWLDSDSFDNPGDSTLTQLNTTLFLIDSTLTQLKSQICQLDSTLTQLIWLRFESNLTHDSSHFTQFGRKLLTGGGGVRSNLIKFSDSTLTEAVCMWLNSDSNDDQRDSTLTRLISLIFTADSILTRLIWVRVESNLTHDSWVEHNPGRVRNKDAKFHYHATWHASPLSIIFPLPPVVSGI